MNTRIPLLVLALLALLNAPLACSSGQRSDSSERRRSGYRAVFDASALRLATSSPGTIAPIRKTLPAGCKEHVRFPAVRRMGPINPSGCDPAADVVVLGQLLNRSRRGDKGRLDVRRTLLGRTTGEQLRVHGGASDLPAMKPAALTATVFSLRAPLHRDQDSYEVLWASRVERHGLMASYAATLWDYHVLSRPSIFEGTAEQLDPAQQRLVVRVTRVLKGPPLAIGSRVSLKMEICMGLRGAVRKLQHQPPMLYFATLDDPANKSQSVVRSGKLGIRLPVSYASRVSASLARRTSYPLYRATDNFGCTSENTWIREPVYLGDPATLLPALRSPLTALRRYAARSLVLRHSGRRLLERAIEDVLFIPRQRWAGEFEHLHRLVSLLEEAEHHHYTGALERLVAVVLDRLEGSNPPHPSPIPIQRTPSSALSMFRCC